MVVWFVVCWCCLICCPEGVGYRRDATKDCARNSVRWMIVHFFCTFDRVGRYRDPWSFQQKTFQDISTIDEFWDVRFSIFALLCCWCMLCKWHLYALLPRILQNDYYNGDPVPQNDYGTIHMVRCVVEWKRWKWRLVGPNSIVGLSTRSGWFRDVPRMELVMHSRTFLISPLNVRKRSLRYLSWLQIVKPCDWNVSPWGYGSTYFDGTWGNVDTESFIGRDEKSVYVFESFPSGSPGEESIISRGSRYRQLTYALQGIPNTQGYFQYLPKDFNQAVAKVDANVKKPIWHCSRYVN